MPLDELLLKVPAQWTRREAQKCWVSFSDKYLEKHGTALHTALCGGNLDQYIDHEAIVFSRYARMWAYRNNLLQIEEPEYKKRRVGWGVH